MEQFETNADAASGKAPGVNRRSRRGQPRANGAAEAAASPADHALLRPLGLKEKPAGARLFTFCALPAGRSLRAPQALGEPVYFLTSGVAALTGFTTAGRSLEVAVIGRSGFTGAELILGNAGWNCRLAMHVAGGAWRIAAGDLQALIERNEAFRTGLLRYSGELAGSIVRTAIASCHGNRTERVARWIAMMQDHVGEPVVRTTHDVIAGAIGAHRPGVTSALHHLEAAHLIRLGRGRLQVIDRTGLLAAARGATAQSTGGARTAAWL